MKVAKCIIFFLHILGKYILRWTNDDNVEADAKSKKIIPKPSDYPGKLPENPFHRKYLKVVFYYLHFTTQILANEFNKNNTFFQAMSAKSENGHKHIERGGYAAESAMAASKLFL